MKAVKGVKVLGLEIEFDHGKLRPRPTSILEAMDLWARDNNRGKLVVIIDEPRSSLSLEDYDIIPATAYAMITWATCRSFLRGIRLVYSTGS